MYNIYIFILGNKHSGIKLSRYLRSVAFKQYVYNFLGKRRICLPACDYDTIWSKFGGKEFQSYDDDEENNQENTIENLLIYTGTILLTRAIKYGVPSVNLLFSEYLFVFFIIYK